MTCTQFLGTGSNPGLTWAYPCTQNGYRTPLYPFCTQHGYLQRPRSECDLGSCTQNTQFGRNLAGMCVHARTQAHAHVRKVKILGTLGTRGVKPGSDKGRYMYPFYFQNGYRPPVTSLKNPSSGDLDSQPDLER